MSILSAIKQQNNSIDDLAALPQALIMQMAQKKQISEEMLAPILARKAEMADAFARQKTLETAGQTPPTVMEQLLARNAETEQPAMEETGVAQLPMPERQYAGGGIVAFDDGGEVGDMAYEMAREDADMNMGSSIQDIFNMAKRGAGRLRGMLPDSYETAKSKAFVEPTSTQPTAFVNERKGNHPLEDKAIAAANKVGLDPRLMIHALYKETGGLKDPATAQSKAGAYGPMQLMAGTAKDLGVDRKDVDQNIYGGALYLKQMMDKYQDPQLALAAYNAGPGRVDKALRSDMGLAALPRETQKYMSFAQGGEVRHFANEGYVDPFGAPPQDYEMDALRIEEINREKRLKEAQEKNEFLKQAAPQLVDKSIPEKVVPKVPSKEEKSKPKEQPKPDLQTIFEDHTRRQQASPERDIFADIFARNEAQREEMKKSAAEDKNLALLASGLGILGGTSPYAFTNIGQGAMKGVEYLGASKGRRASEMNALSASDLKAMYYGEENKRKQRALNEGLAERAIDNIAAYDAKFRKNYFMEGVAPSPKQIEAYENAKRNDPIYQRLIKDAGVTAQAQPQRRTINFSTI
jgi:hypothetical protein